MNKPFGFPKPFADRMKVSLADSFESFEESHRQNPPVSLRFNPKKKEIAKYSKIPWADVGCYMEQRPSFTFDPLFHAGVYYVQEASSMFLEQALKQTVDLTLPLVVLDLCAAPGGKSTHLLSLLNDQSLLVSNETIGSRATILSENIQKWGYGNAVVTNNDPEDFHKLEGFFDVILVDAPCSGEGLFRKDPRAMQQWTEENASLCSMRQQRIIKQIWPSLKQGGIMIYCTCTYNEKENEENLDSLIAEKKAVGRKLSIKSDWGIEEVKKGNVFGYRFYPHRVKGEGFFISVVQKNQKQNEFRIHAKSSLYSPPKKINDRLAQWVIHPEETEFILHDNLILSLPKKYFFEIDALTKVLKVIQKGTAVATLKHDKLIPEHAFALSTTISAENFPGVQLTHEDAIAYLRKDVLNPASEEHGFNLMKHQHVPLGWGNLLGNRMNNLYPSAWRIRNEVDTTLPA
jgi:16S rRNA C967 or C1407 C5-methylase (RsmB/RsmF family)/NOL1/NOP2/fmu family ribosome biogenesis protein